MNGAQLHLALNHIPVVLSMASVAILLWGWVCKNNEIKKVGLALTVATAVFAVAAFLTGEPAEEVLEKLPSLSAGLVHVHEHEEAGEFALSVSIIAGVCALATLFFAKKKPLVSSRVYVVTVLVLLVSSLAFLKTAHVGGLIRHDEIRTQ